MSEEIKEEVSQKVDETVQSDPKNDHMLFIYLTEEGNAKGTISKDYALNLLKNGQRVFLVEKELVFQ